MAGFDHGAPSEAEQEHGQTIARNARVGLVLFALYCALYLGFMLICAFWPAAREQIVFRGLNLAIVYGFGLILAAFALALVYSWICRAPAAPREVER